MPFPEVGDNGGTRLSLRPVKRLTFRGLSFVSESEVDLVLDADDGTTVSWRFTRTEHRGIGIINGPEGFAATYRASAEAVLPGVAGAARPTCLRCASGTVPGRRSRPDAIEESRAEVARRWNEAHEAD